MREILFRGKCIELGKHQGQWLEGFYGEDDGRSLISHSTDIGLIGYACDSDTIGQYTGLKDRNGKKIFEGDILLFEMPFDEPYFGVVTYSTEAARFEFEGNDAYWVNPEKRCTIIGNIYDNPELLKGD